MRQWGRKRDEWRGEEREGEGMPCPHHLPNIFMRKRCTAEACMGTIGQASGDWRGQAVSQRCMELT